MFTLSSTAAPSYPMFQLRDLDTQRVYRPCDLTETPLIRPTVANYVAGGVDTGGKHNLVIESVRSDTRYAGPSIIPVPVDGAGGLPIA